MTTTATTKENIKNFFILNYLLSVVGGLFPAKTGPALGRVL
jgi:hypothetical protein